VPLEFARAVAAVFEAYVVAGVAFAVMFLPRALDRLDPRVTAAAKTLRLLILPGVVALWPMFAWRWAIGAAEPTERNPHRTKAAWERASR
jgi:hypothetical protein